MILPLFFFVKTLFCTIISFDGELIKGEFPKKQLKLVEAWSIIHIDELKANWLLCKNSNELFYIQPLS